MKSLCRYFVVTLFLISLLACGNAKKTTKQPPVEKGVADYIKSVKPAKGLKFVEGDMVSIMFELSHDSIVFDSAFTYIDGGEPIRMDRIYSYKIKEGHRVGRIPFFVEVFYDGKSSISWGEFTVRAVQTPDMYTYKIKHAYPHDNTAYTQGLFWHDGWLYESTGLTGSSTLRKVVLESGRVSKSVNIGDEYFGEGSALLGDKIYQLTWQDNKGFVYDLNTFEKLDEFGYAGEGWGLTTDGEYLYMSNGTERINVLDPETLRTVRSIDVYTNKDKVVYLNELEWIDGEIWANVYTEDYIVRIDPRTGAVKGVVDLSGLVKHTMVTPQTDVLNGIAYDAGTGRVFVTGKNWNKVFEIEVIKK